MNYNKEWRLNNPKRYKELQKRYREKNREKINAYQRNLYHKNKGEVLTREEVINRSVAARNKKAKKKLEEMLTLGLRTCSMCKVKKNLDEYYPEPRGMSMLQAACKECQGKKNKEYNKRKREVAINKHGGFCELCQLKIEKNIKYALHHILYKPEIIILLCHKCHNTLHSLRIYKLDFVKKHGSDMAPYEWAKRIINLYDKKLKKRTG